MSDNSGKGLQQNIPGWVIIFLFVAIVIVDQTVPGSNLIVLRIAGVVTLLVSAIFMYLPFVQLGRYGKSVGKNYTATTVVADSGLYAVVRHPQYLGYMFLFAGFALISQNWITALLAVLAIGFLHFNVSIEEQANLEKFGNDYHDYIQRVPRYNILLGLWRTFRER